MDCINGVISITESLLKNLNMKYYNLLDPISKKLKNINKREGKHDNQLQSIIEMIDELKTIVNLSDNKKITECLQSLSKSIIDFSIRQTRESLIYICTCLLDLYESFLKISMNKISSFIYHELIILLSNVRNTISNSLNSLDSIEFEIKDPIIKSIFLMANLKIEDCKNVIKLPEILNIKSTCDLISLIPVDNLIEFLISSRNRQKIEDENSKLFKRIQNTLSEIQEYLSKLISNIEELESSDKSRDNENNENDEKDEKGEKDGSIRCNERDESNESIRCNESNESIKCNESNEKDKSNESNESNEKDENDKYYILIEELELMKTKVYKFDDNEDYKFDVNKDEYDILIEELNSMKTKVYNFGDNEVYKFDDKEINIFNAEIDTLLNSTFQKLNGLNIRSGEPLDDEINEKKEENEKTKEHEDREKMEEHEKREENEKRKETEEHEKMEEHEKREETEEYEKKEEKDIRTSPTKIFKNFNQDIKPPISRNNSPVYMKSNTVVKLSPSNSSEKFTEHDIIFDSSNNDNSERNGENEIQEYFRNSKLQSILNKYSTKGRRKIDKSPPISSPNDKKDSARRIVKNRNEMI